jgi:hypothetical protein
MDLVNQSKIYGNGKFIVLFFGKLEDHIAMDITTSSGDILEWR